MSEQNFEAAAPTEEAYIDVETPVAPEYRKQGMNIYTVMLVISFISLVIGTILLFIEANRFGGWDTKEFRPQTSVTPVSSSDNFLV